MSTFKMSFFSFISFCQHCVFVSTLYPHETLYASLNMMSLSRLLYISGTINTIIKIIIVIIIITSLAKEVMFLVALVSLSVCLFVCGQHYSKSYERIGMKFYGRFLSSTRKN